MRDGALADDVVQQTFVKAWRAASRYDAARRLEPWLFQIARRTAIDVHRAETRAQRRAAAAGNLVEIDDGADDMCRRFEIDDALGRLATRDRELLTMLFYDELTQTDVAHRLGIPLGTVKSRSHRALARLARIWEQDRLAS